MPESKNQSSKQTSSAIEQTSAYKTALKDEKSKRIAQLTARAWADPHFKEKLLTNPREAFDEYKIEVPDGITLKVLENTNEVIHFILTPPPINLSKIEFGNLPIHVMDCPCSHSHDKDTFCHECWHCSD
jgi:hypothetical protein